ncbi:hypothetical protein HYC85_023190 [Camellia sinensis]|uniref:Uncharacterized protein n=1 Tax=Camellia sinensis TaxID=4442 RepID=A0A7J7GG71_CAMSI|nr:hypothetical protein HYC85_023190 [Camellia sinensis]
MWLILMKNYLVVECYAVLIIENDFWVKFFLLEQLESKKKSFSISFHSQHSLSSARLSLVSQLFKSSVTAIQLFVNPYHLEKRFNSRIAIQLVYETHLSFGAAIQEICC